MRRIQGEELRSIQMSILDNIDKFCKENDIRYSLSGGTLLGAVRHGGYIPWDDDIDICMLREDYNRFEMLFPKVYNSCICFASLKRNKDWRLAFGKAYDNRTYGKLIGAKNVSPGVNIDIFPMDEVPDSEDEWKRYNDKRLSLLKKLRRSGWRISSHNSLNRNISVLLLNIRYFFVNRRVLAEKINEYSQKNTGKGYSRIFENTMGMSMKNNPMKKAIFNDICEIEFEHRKYMGFRNYDEYLTCAFGDYMTPPPIDKRVSTHAVDFYWK